VLNKTEIDNEFSRLYAELLNISAGMSEKNGKAHDARMLVNEAYLYISKKSCLIDEVKKVRIYSIKFIRDSIKWENSDISIHGEGGRMIQKKYNPISEDRIKKDELQKYFEAEQDLEKKILEHQREVNFRVLKSHYYAEVKDPVLKRIFEAYVLEGEDSQLKFSQRFNISQTSAFRQIKALKTDLKKFAEKYGYIEKG
jgi:hypothetical protein